MRYRTIPARLRATGAVALAELRYHRASTALAVVGVAVAVLLVVVLGGLGYGMVTTGDEAIDWFNNDLWVTGDRVALTPESVGGVDNPIHGAHELRHDLEAHDGVRYAQPVAFQSVYVSPDERGFDTIIGVGVGGDAGRLRIASRFNRRDTHYAGGSYDGPMTRRIIVGPQIASRYGLSEGDTLHVGGTIASARENEFTVVGVTGDFSNFLGAPTVGMHLSELQEVSGTTGTDPASVVALTLEPGADAAAVERDIERQYPELHVRTDDEQVQAIITDQAPLLASAGALVGMAVLGGIGLVVNVLAMLVHQQRRQVAALKITGLSVRTLVAVVTLQGALLGVAGGVLGLTVAIPAAALLDGAIEHVTGYAGLVQTPPWLLVLAIGLALVTGTLGASVAGWRVARLDPLDQLQS